MRLREFRAVGMTTDGTCSRCGTSGGVVTFRYSAQCDQQATHTLCKSCFMRVGRKTNIPVGTTLMKCETVDCVHLDDDNNVIIETSSPLGNFSHVYYTSTANAPTGDLSEGEPETERTGLTGVSEVFDDTGQFAFEPSPYTELAESIVSNE